jgi:hypothetical protein
MKTPIKPLLAYRSAVKGTLAILILCALTSLLVKASPLDWLHYFDQEDAVNEGEVITGTTDYTVALSCLPEVNVSLGQQGFAIITGLMLVNAPTCPLYEVDIMGPLNDTVFCAQIGQELMVLVTETCSGNSCMSTIFVEDKLKPVLSCTPDTLPCNVDIPSIDFESLIDSATDNCDDDLDMYYSYTIQNLPCNPHHFTQQINVIWTATDDSGNSTSCMDVIYLKKPAPGEIDFPSDISVDCTNPNIDPSVTGEPTFNGEPLGLTCQYIVFHTDQVVPMCNGAQKIIRLWTVMDWCNSAQITDVQEILIIDDTPPVITCPPNITVGTSPGVCTTAYTLPFPVVSDECANAAMIDIDIFVSGVPGIFSPGQVVQLGIGTTNITIRATDPCGNSSLCVYTVTVRDNTPPVIACHTLTVGIGADGMAFLYADLLPFTIIENCGILSKQIWRMTNTCNTPEDLIPGPDVKFCCADVGDTLMVAFKVTDVSGNMNTCMFQVIVKDLLPPVVDCEDISISITDQGTIIVDPDLVVNSASDNCFLVDTTITPGTFDCDDIGENIVVVTVTDQSGNTATCTAIVTITDTVPPLAVCENITVTVDANGVVVIVTEDINNGSSDNCAIDTMYLNEYEFDCDEEGVNIVTLTVVDEAGNIDQCTATVTVLTSPPVAICQDITVSLDDNGIVVITGVDIDNGSFDDCDTVTFFVTPDTFDCDDIGVNIVTLTVMDDAGNASTCTATVTVEDNTPPIALCQDITVMLDDNGMATITADLIDNGSNDNCDEIDLEIDISEFDCENAGPNIVTLTVTDASGNTSTCTAIVTVLMPDPPTAVCQDITVFLDANGIVVIEPEDVDNGSTAQCGDVTLELDVDTLDCEDLGLVIVTLTVTDATGATSTCTATVTVVDEVDPICSSQDITVYVDAAGNVSITASQVNDGSTDNCDTITLSVTPDDFTCEDLGPNVVVLTVTDLSGNSSTCTATVTVQDTISPVCNAQDITVSLDGDMVIITADDVNDGSTDNCIDIFLEVTPDTFDCEDVGPNIVVLTVTDGSGNSSTCTSIVTVLMPDPPVAICQDITVALGPDGMVVITAAQIDGGSESECGDVTLEIDEDTFDCTEIGPNIVILTVTDEGGSTSTCTATVTVVDDMGPVCSAADITVFVDANGNVSITADQVDDGSADNCEDVTLSVTPDDFTCDDLGPNVVTLTVTDESGNSSTCTATVTVVDTIAPVCITQDITVTLIGNIVTITASQVDDGSSDNCGVVNLDVDPDTFDCEDLGPNVVILTVTDNSGNSSTCTAIVTVEEGAGGLVANCQNITIFLDANGNASVDPEDVNNGSGGGCTADSLTFDLSQTNFNCTDIGPNVVTLTVTDEEGNTATCTATITVVDNMPPVITCPPNVTVNCDAITDPNNTDQFGDATATDNCPPVTIIDNAVFNLNDCNVGTITRTFTAFDNSGNTATCVQTVTIINPNPFDEDDITWPASPITVNICNSTDPDEIPNGEPTFDVDALQCANPLATFSDVVQMIIDDDPNTPCKIITRTWTVTDNCQPNGTFVFVQTINVVDTANPVFTNINDMTKTANENCVAFFTLIASATDCAGVTITNNSPYGATTGANASGNYPIGQTVVIFTATDGCGRTSTMDVVITVIDPDPTDFLCEKVIVILPPETEIELHASTFITFIPGGCTDANDFIISYSPTDPFDTTNIYDCGDVGVTTFSLWFWNLSGTMVVDSCDNADLDLRDPDDNCMDGLVLIGNVESEDGFPVSDVNVNITNAPMLPGTTNDDGGYLIEGLAEGTGYEVAPFHDLNHREGVSTLDLVLIQKHLLGRAKLNSPYKMIAADANKSGHITAYDLLEIRKLILGINTRFPSNTSWRFVDKAFSFPDPYDPFKTPIAESIWVDSVTAAMGSLDFVGIKIGDVNASYFHSLHAGSKIEQRSAAEFEIRTSLIESVEGETRLAVHIGALQGKVDGMQLTLEVGEMTDEQLSQIHSGILGDDHWYYDPTTGLLNISWSVAVAEDISERLLISWPVSRPVAIDLASHDLVPEAYFVQEGDIEIRKVVLGNGISPEESANEYHLYQNKPNPFFDGTVISFVLPQDENIRLLVHDVTGKLVYEHAAFYSSGRHELEIKGDDLGSTGIYYYTLHSNNASFTRKMSFTNN